MEQHNPAFEKIPLSVTNPFSENLRRLAALFPSIVKDGQVDLDALKAELGEFEEVDKERYELTWAGKQEAKRTAGEPVIGRTLKYVPEESKDPESTENLYIEGDNLEVLKLLQNAYIGKIKMIYIDPPYNTGNDFVYKDHFAVTAEENAKAEGDVSAEGERYAVNPKTSGKYHANWLSMMYPRLRLAKNLLRDDGVIFISIDDNEVGNLREICDEIFGGENFVAIVPWRKRTAKSDVPFGISQDYEWVIGYAKQNFIASIAGNERKYFETPDLPNRPWRVHDLTTQRSAAERPNSYFTMINPKNGLEYPANPKRTWAVTKDTFEEYYNKNMIVFPGDYDFLNITNPVFRYYKDEDQMKAGELFGFIPMSTNLPSEVGMSLDGTKDFGHLFENKLFSFPKPVGLIKYLIQAATSIQKDVMILDFFSGSATTAHSVMQLNAEDGGTRKFIMVQLPEACDEKSEAFGAGYKTICDIGKERIRRAGDKIQKEHPEASPDTGFNVFRLADTNIRWIAAETGQVSLEDALITSGKDLRDFMPGYTDKDVVYEILLRQYDIPLTAKIESLGEIGKRTYSVARALIVCLEESITNDIIDKIAKIEPVPHKIIFRDSAFGDDISLKENTMMRLDALMQKHSSGGKTPYRVEFL
ncbi:site-specific DNA-methyltransferase [Methanocorpusculum bavaricum]|uniref:site-specific DNA-methyltransferase n=1 Tax=Methanocorpusculum bavaricum TaxID=71518 RepID=UPI0005B2E7AB|nr:site-specific DNA-methyltransferase [Methanocorpusculum bavaricum]